MVSGHVWLEATILGGAIKEHFHCGKFYWTVLLWKGSETDCSNLLEGCGFLIQQSRDVQMNTPCVSWYLLSGPALQVWVFSVRGTKGREEVHSYPRTSEILHWSFWFPGSSVVQNLLCYILDLNILKDDNFLLSTPIYLELEFNLKCMILDYPAFLVDVTFNFSKPQCPWLSNGNDDST